MHKEFFFQFSYDKYGVVLVLLCVLFQVLLLHACLSRWLHQLLPYHLKISSKVWDFVLCDLCSLAILWWLVLSAVVIGHLVTLPAVVHVSSCIFRCLYGVNMYLHISYFFIFCFLYGFVWKASLLWRDLDQVCILFWLCSGGLWGGFVVVFVIGLLCLFGILPHVLVICDCNVYSPLLRSSNDGTFEIL